jgi:hypothetical protein
MVCKFLLASVGAIAILGSAFAADFPVNPPPPPVPTFTWTGVYLGGQVGYAWGNDKPNWAIETPFAFFFDTFNDGPQGVIGGAHVGYNLQINQWVIGVEPAPSQRHHGPVFRDRSVAASESAGNLSWSTALVASLSPASQTTLLTQLGSLPAFQGAMLAFRKLAPAGPSAAASNMLSPTIGRYSRNTAFPISVISRMFPLTPSSSPASRSIRNIT